MARLARAVFPGVAHHVTQRGDGGALVYVALKPVRAKLVDHAVGWSWLSAHTHLGLVTDDGLTATAPVLERFSDLAARVAASEDLVISERLSNAGMIGRPAGARGRKSPGRSRM